jgi:uncharacterized protein YneF (UPF0154 family)
MNTEYLLTPVIDLDDGDELKSFRIYYLFLIAFFFGLLSVIVPGVRNCLWLRAKKTVWQMFIILSVLALIGKYAILGSYYYAHSDQIKKNPNLERKSISRQLPSSVTNNASEEKADAPAVKNPVAEGWESLKDNMRIYEKVVSILLLLFIYFAVRKNYNLVVHLTGSIQPLLKWGAGSVVGAVLLEMLIGQILFGGSL